MKEFSSYFFSWQKAFFLSWNATSRNIFKTLEFVVFWDSYYNLRLKIIYAVNNISASLHLIVKSLWSSRDFILVNSRVEFFILHNLNILLILIWHFFSLFVSFFFSLTSKTNYWNLIRLILDNKRHCFLLFSFRFAKSILFEDFTDSRRGANLIRNSSFHVQISFIKSFAKRVSSVREKKNHSRFRSEMERKTESSNWKNSKVILCFV